ncbi:MAG: GNAT family N-acetyltransferase [Defluviitaleaceae bacterium]|nr:GNAT family N-acetyltransferase [Defluviitaleaceae bacterium]
MGTKDTAQWNVYEMEYAGGAVMSSIAFVPFSINHYDKYIALMNECFYEMRKALNVQPYAEQHRGLDSPHVLAQNTYLYLDDNEIVCAVTIDGNVIKSLAVNQKYQRQGYARKAMLFAMHRLQSHNISPLKLTVTKWNERALALHKSLGFLLTREYVVKGYNTQNADGSYSFVFEETTDLEIR